MPFFQQVLVSDGDWNAGDPPAQAAMQLRMRDIPVFAVPVGAESHLPDVELSSFDVPTFAVAGKPLRIPFTIESSLPQDEPATLEELSVQYGVSRERVRQIEVRAFEKLQKAMKKQAASRGLLAEAGA